MRYVVMGIVAAVLLLAVGKLYMTDAAAVRQALVVREFLVGYCRENNRYPELDVLQNEFPALYPDGDWYYWPHAAGVAATFQYPMTLPLSSAPGRAKVSEFFPVIYAYAVRDPCDE